MINLNNQTQKIYIILQVMNIKYFIPNLLTLCNLLCGLLSIFVLLKGLHLEFFSKEYNYLSIGCYLIFMGGIFDLLDGLFARLLNAKSKIGQQLDSFADFATFGIAPCFILWNLISLRIMETEFAFISYGVFIFPFFSALRLAKFNLDINQNFMFKGLPTPAAAFFIAGLLWFPYNFLPTNNFSTYTIPWYETTLLFITLCLCFLMVSSLKMFSLKFKNWSWHDNKLKYIFVLIAMILFLTYYFAAISIIVVLYLFLSITNNLFENEV